VEANRERGASSPEVSQRADEIARTVEAVEAGNLVTIPRAEPRRLSDEELGGRAALEAAGLEPVDGWDDERPVLERLRRENAELRAMLAISYGGAGVYTDDGELQDCREHPFIDFRRDSLPQIAEKMTQRARAAGEFVRKAVRS